MSTNIEGHDRQRDSNIELLRILAIIGVIILHYNNPAIGGALAYSAPINRVLLYWLESVAVCAVDLFMLISGYFMARSERRSLWKVVELVAQVIVFKIALYLIRVVLGNAFSLTGLLGCFLPANYFVILYCVVFVVSPYVGFAMNKLSKKNLMFLVGMLIVCFSIWPTLVDFVETVSGHSLTGLNPLGMFGDGAGYTFVNFLLCWIVGAYLRISEMTISRRKCIVVFLCLTLLIGCYAKLMLAAGAELEYAFSYCSPLIIIEAATVFMIFKQIHLQQNRIINALAKGTFTVYLLNNLFLTHIRIEHFVQANTGIMLLHIIGSVVVIYMICWCVYFIYNLIMSRVWAWVKAKVKLPDIGIADNEG